MKEQASLFPEVDADIYETERPLARSSPDVWSRLNRHGHKRTTRFLLAYTALCVLWLAVAVWIAPRLVRDAYAGRSLPVLNDLIEGQAIHPIDFYLDSWRRLALQLTHLLAALGVGGYMTIGYWPRIRDFGRRLVAGLPEMGFAATVRFAVGFGLLAGCGESIIHYVKSTLSDSPLDTGSGAFLLGPVMAVASFLILGCIFALAGRPSALRHRLGLAVLVSVFLTFFGLVDSLRFGLHRAAVALLALGLSAQTIRFMNGHPARFRSALRVGTITALAVIFVFSAAPPLMTRVAEGRALERLPQPPPAAPNVLLIILDTVRAQNLGLYGYARETTPNLERFAAQGVVFERAVSTSPWTLPSHASLFTGGYHHQVSADWDSPLDDALRTLAEELRDRGYETVGFVANRQYAGVRSGLDRGFVRYDARASISWWNAESWSIKNALTNLVRRARGDHGPWWRTSADEINERFVGWLSGRATRPFFAFLNYMDAHDPYLPPEPYNLRFSETQPRYWGQWVHHKAPLDPDELTELIDAYDSCIYYLDSQLGQLFAALESRGVLENTLVIVTSDHGEEFGEHVRDTQILHHGRSLYWPSLHVPLVISFRGHIPAGKRVGEAVSLRDIPATVMEFVDPTGHPFPGTPLLRDGGEPENFFTGASAPLSQVNPGAIWPPGWRESRGSFYSLVAGSWHFILDSVQEELFDLDADPWQQRNLIEHSDKQALADSLRKAIHSTIPVAELP